MIKSAVSIKSADEIAAMRTSCRILAEILRDLRKDVAPGITPYELDARAEALMKKRGVIPSFKGYRGFPAVTCINVNEQVVHAIPNKRPLKEGDIVSIDCGVIYDSFHSDSAITVCVGKVAPEVVRFVKTVEQAILRGIAQVAPGKRTGDIAAAIQKTVEGAGFSVSRQYIGHGIGRNLHEAPEVPNVGRAGTGTALVPGMTIAIEPICMMGKRFTDTLQDGWTVVTRDGAWAAQIEHTVLVTPTGQEILTA